MDHVHLPGLSARTIRRFSLHRIEINIAKLSLGVNPRDLEKWGLESLKAICRFVTKDHCTGRGVSGQFPLHKEAAYVEQKIGDAVEYVQIF